MSKTWRLLDYSSADPKMNLAINEAIFRSRREGLTEDTLCLGQSQKSAVVLGTQASYEQANLEVCRKYDVEIIRAVSVVGEVLYQEIGSLNFTIAADVAPFKHLITNYQPVLSEYQILNESVAKGLQRFGVEVKADPYGIFIDNRRVSEALPLWFYDFLLFQGNLLINTNLDVYDKVTRMKHSPEKKGTLTSLSHELGRDINIDEAKKTLVQGFEERLGIRFESQGLTDDELKLSKKLYEIKYSLSKWNVDAHESFLLGMGKTAVEVFVAYPPTSMCHILIDLVRDVVSDIPKEVEVKVWMRGKGLYQHGPCPELSSGLHYAEKHSKIPAIIVNGDLKFQGTIPSTDDLRRIILNAV